MKNYKISIDVEALEDIQQATNWYNEQCPGLGTNFQNQVKLQINDLKKHALIYAIRYKNVHCNIVKKFPFMIHYTIDEVSNLVKVFAIIHTSRNPKIWKKRKN